MRVADFIEEKASAIAGTNGDGAVTLSASGTRPRFSHAFPNGAYVRYSMEDTTTGKLESGYGYVVGNLLTRVKPRTTWDGTNYVTKNATPLQFGATPAANTVTVRLAQVADTAAPSIQTYNQKVFAGIDTVWNQFPLSSHFTGWPAGQGWPFANNSDFYSYYRLEVGGTLQGIQFEVSTAFGAGAALKLALYDLGVDGLPAKKIVDFPATDVSTSGVKTLTDTTLWAPAEPVTLTPGWYAFGGRMDIGNGYLRAFLNGVALNQLQTPLGRSASYAGYKSVIVRTNSYDTSALPVVPDFTTGSPSIATAAGLWIGMKVVP